MTDQADTGLHERRLIEEMHQVQAEVSRINERCARRFGGVGDLADQAYHTVEAGTNETLRCLHQRELGHLKRAWTRFCEGQYGICESCGMQIEPSRLEVIPYATLCAKCRRQGRFNAECRIGEHCPTRTARLAEARL